MGNSLRGEADLQVGDRTFGLVFCWNAAVEFEDAAGRSLWEAMVGKLTAKSVRAMLWAGLREKHPEVTLEEAGRLIDVAGREKAVAVMKKAMRHFFPELDKILGTEPPGGGSGAAAADPPGPAPAPAAPGSPAPGT